MSAPVFVMGLPRSGSTLLSRLLNFSPDILCVNDLYFVQAVLAEGSEKSILQSDTAARLVDQLLEVISTRADANDEFIGQFTLPSSEIIRIHDLVLQEHAKSPMSWHELMDRLLTLVAVKAGKARWADKTPQNFYHFDVLAASFPTAKFIFLLRQPYDVLASYKFAGGDGHDLRRYHPLAYSLYWRTAVRYFEKLKSNPSVLLIRYEDIITQPENTGQALSSFLNTTINIPSITTLGHNSSFAAGNRKQITDTEKWICNSICRREMNVLRYPESNGRLSLTGFSDLARTTTTFFLFQFNRMRKDRDARHRVRSFVRGLLMR